MHVDSDPFVHRPPLSSSESERFGIVKRMNSLGFICEAV